MGFLIDILYPNYNPDFVKGLIVRMGVGLGIYPIIGIILNYLHLVYYWMFLGIGCAIGLIALFWRKPKINLKIKWQPLIILGLVGASMFMYIGGSYAYPWFENSDPWEYAETSKYVGETGTYSSPFYFNHFAEPYTQGYQIVMGTIYQINHSIYDTMKVFHNLIISFTVIFFFYFMLRLSNNYRIALLSSIFLWAVPAFFSHFIFALTFNMTIMMVFFYTLLRKWRFISILLFASLWVSHFYTAFIATIFLVIIYISRVIATKKFNKEYIQIGFFGILLSFLFWVPAYFKYVEFDLLDAVPAVGGAELFFPYWKIISIVVALGMIAYFTHPLWFKYVVKLLESKKMKYIYWMSLGAILLVLLIPSPGSIMFKGGSGDRVYGLGDFFIAKGQGLFNNPVGIGLVVMSLFTIGLIFVFLNFDNLLERDNLCLFTSFNLALFSLIGVFGKSLSVGFLPFRMWTFFAIPCAMMAGITLSKICSLIEDSLKEPKGINKLAVIVLIILICFGVYITSFKQKYELNTSMWPEHKIYSPKGIELYHTTGLPPGTRLTGLCHPTILANSYDFDIEPWASEEIARYHKIAMNQTVEENHAMYKKYNISYIIVDIGCYSKFNYPPDVLNNKVISLEASPLFKVQKVTDEAVLFKVI